MAQDPDTKDFLLALGAHIKELRVARGWSNRDISTQHGFDDSQWRRYERGNGLSIDTLLRIARCFNLSLREVLDGLADYPLAPIPSVTSKELGAAKIPAKKGIKQAGNKVARRKL